MSSRRAIQTGFLATAALTALWTLPAHALRCDSRVIARGDPAAKVLRFCGDPEYVQSRVIQRALYLNPGGFVGGLSEEVVVEEWTYNFGPYKLMAVVELENGEVTNVRYLGYGYLAN